MSNNYYVVVIKKLSNDSIERTITPYGDKDVALRKYHEAFNVIGGGPKRITAMIIQDSINEHYGQITNAQGELEVIRTFDVGVIAQETWVDETELANLADN